jgi:Sigma-70, region 4.
MRGFTHKAKQLRNKKIIDLHKTGDFTYEDIGDIYGVSRQRAYQIIHYAKKTIDKTLTGE